MWLHKIDGIHDFSNATYFYGSYHVDTYSSRTPGLRIGTSEFIPCFFALTETLLDKLEWQAIWQLPDFFQREAELKAYHARYEQQQRIARAEYEQKQAAFRAKKQQEQAQQQATPQEPKQLVLF